MWGSCSPPCSPTRTTSRTRCAWRRRSTCWRRSSGWAGTGTGPRIGWRRGCGWRGCCARSTGSTRRSGRTRRRGRRRSRSGTPRRSCSVGSGGRNRSEAVATCPTRDGGCVPIEAERAYEEAGAQAEPIGDSHSQLLSRIGRAESLRGRGNLPDAERWLRTILADADAIGDAEAHALGHHVLAAVLSTAGRSAEAIPHMWRAFESYEDATSRGRALADLGALFLILGNSEDAERALTEAVRRGGAQDFATNALIELMNCASFRRDRVGFERWREECEKRRETMPPNVLVDFMLKMGIGRARFEQFDRAHALLAGALQTAESAGLHEFVFRIERVKNGLRECQPTEVVETPEPQTEAVREVSASLARLEV